AVKDEAGGPRKAARFFYQEPDMIIVMEPEAGDAEIAAVEARIRAAGLEVHISRGTERTLIGAIGDERKLDPEMFDPLPGVERSMHILKPYKLVAREWHRASTIVNVDGAAIGGNAVQVIAGPCSVETQPQMNAAADGVAAAGARLMRGGAFKPRTSPYAFQGKGVEGLTMLRNAAARHGLLIVDPSHAGGKAWMVPALSCAGVAAGADALLIEVHPCPPEAWCDADQALTPAEFGALMDKLDALSCAMGRTLERRRSEATIEA